MRVMRLLPLMPFANSLKSGAIVCLVLCRSGLCRCYPDICSGFRWYLHKIAHREPPAACRECGVLEDTARYTLLECVVWFEPRRILEAAVGSDLSLSSVMRAMFGG